MGEDNYINQINHNIGSTQKDTLWPQLTSSRGIGAGWSRVLGNAGAAGGDGITISAYSLGLEARLESLRQSLIHGRYRPGPYRRVHMPKKDGGERPLDIPCIADRIVQSAAAQLLSPVIDRHLEPESFAYRPGRGVAQAIAAVAAARRDGYRWTAEGDVERCFEEIPHETLLRRLETVCGDEKVTDLVALWLEAFAPGGIGLPQGSPISPLLCNLHLDTVDEAVRGHGVRLVRYADDFVLLSKTAAGAEIALERMVRALREHGLSLNPDKTRIRDYDRSLRFLGHVFTRSMVWKEVWSDEGDSPPDAPREDQLSESAPDSIELGERVQPATRHSPRQRVLYMVEAGRRLSIRNESFVVRDDGADRLLVHASRLDRIEIGPGASADWAALELAAAHDVELVRVDHWGRGLGFWTGQVDPRARRLAAQSRMLADPARADALACAIAEGRLRNQRALLSRLNRTRKDAGIAAACVEIGRTIRRFEVPLQTNVARGWEGRGSQVFWPAYAKAFGSDWRFDGHRRRRPPPDAINACLSYASALLERDLRVAVARAGLHAGIGALHPARDDDGPALVFDLMEAFRSPVVEALVAALVARRALKPGMFLVTDWTDETGDTVRVCRIEPAARKALIRGYEAWVARPIQSHRTGREMLWRGLFEEEVQALAAWFEEDIPFRPYRMDY